MWAWSRAGFERRLESLLHTHDTPRRTALALALGVGLGFSPFLGFHLIIGVFLAFVLNLNRVAVIGGVCLNLPWIMGLYYAGATALGTWILGAKMPDRLMHNLEAAWNLPQWGARIDAVGGLLEPLLWPFTMGSLIGSATLAFAAYRLSLPILVALRRRHDDKIAHEAERPTGKSIQDNS